MAHQHFVWKSGRSFNVPADVVHDHIERIQKREGDCSARSLVDAARPESSSVHPLFEWDDAIAGENWRLNQARVVICSIRAADEPERPAYVSARVVTTSRSEDDEPEDVSYRSVAVVEADREDRRAWLLREFATIRGHLLRVQAEPEFAPLVDALPLVAAALSVDADRLQVAA